MTAARGGRAMLTVRGPIATVRLRNDGKRNALDLQMADDIIAACDRIDAGDCTAAVLVGHDGYFCSGADREVLDRAAAAASDRDAAAILDHVYESFLRIGELRVPVIAAVRGGALGAGLNLALAADLRIVANNATLFSGFRERAIHHGGGQGYLISALAGPQAATAMILFGERISGRRAGELGLAWSAVPDDAVDSMAQQLAAVAASTPSLSATMVASLRGERMAAWRHAAAAERDLQVQTLRAAK